MPQKQCFSCDKLKYEVIKGRCPACSVKIGAQHTVRQDCTAPNLIETIEYIGYDNITSLTSNKSQMRHLLSGLDSTDYDNKPESFTILFDYKKQHECNSKEQK